MKRTFDFVVAALGLVLLMPVMLIIGYLVSRSSPGGALFVQARVGKSEKLFDCYKFRTMARGAPVAGSEGGGIDLAGEVRDRLTDQNVAEFIAHSVSRDHGATNRLAQAFQTLVPDADKRSSLIDLAEDAAKAMPFSRQADFPDLWKLAKHGSNGKLDAGTSIQFPIDRERHGNAVNPIGDLE